MWQAGGGIFQAYGAASIEAGLQVQVCLRHLCRCSRVEGVGRWLVGDEVRVRNKRGHRALRQLYRLWHLCRGQ